MPLTPPAHRVPLTFADSPRSTLGIEWELQLVDRDSLDLRQCTAEILTLIDYEIGRACVGKECRSRWSPYH